MVVIIAFAADAIDAGRAWASRRHLVTAADAGALAGGQGYAEGSNGCSSAGSSVDANFDSATMTACNPKAVDATRGYVTVQAKTTLNDAFATVFGQKSKDLLATTTAQWGIPRSIAGLRPFGLCIQANQQLADWLAHPVVTSAVDRITSGTDQPGACGSAPGNWGVVDFDGGANSNNDTKTWTLSGYPGSVSVGDTLSRDTGAISNALDAGLGYLKSSGGTFAVPVFDTITQPGANARMHIVAFVLIKLVDYQVTGNQAARYLDVVFTNCIVSGPCCAVGGVDTGARAIRICDVNMLAPDTSDPRAC
jgi:hypothetical protein